MKRVLVLMFLVSMMLGTVGIRDHADAQIAGGTILLSCVEENESWQIDTVDAAPAELIVPDVEGCAALLTALAPDCTVRATLDQTGRVGAEVLHVLKCGLEDR